jgi:hypothetical protein
MKKTLIEFLVLIQEQGWDSLTHEQKVTFLLYGSSAIYLLVTHLSSQSEPALPDKRRDEKKR